MDYLRITQPSSTRSSILKPSLAHLIAWLFLLHIGHSQNPLNSVPSLNVVENRSASPAVRSSAIDKLLKQGEAATLAIPKLIDILSDRTDDPIVRGKVITALLQIDQQPQNVIGILFRIFLDRSEDNSLREAAALAFTQWYKVAKEAIPRFAEELVKASTDRAEDEKVRIAAVDVLAAMGADLKDNPSKSFEALVELVRNPNEPVELRIHTLRAVSSINPGTKSPQVVQAFVAALTDTKSSTDTRTSELRRIAAERLGYLKEAAKEAAPALVEALSNKREDADVRAQAARALGKIGAAPQEVVQPLIDPLMDKGDLKEVRKQAAYALMMLGENASRATSTLDGIIIDKNEGPEIRIAAIAALGAFGASAKMVLPHLTELLKDPDDGIRATALNSIVSIARRLKEEKDLNAISALKTASEAIKKMPNPPPNQAEQSKELETIIDALEEVRKKEIWPNIKAWILRNRVASVIGFYLLVALSISLVLLWVRPLWILWINQALKQPFVEFSLPAFLGALKLPTRYFLVIGLFVNHRRVLDAWVAKYLDRARKSFESKDAVRNRNIYVGLPVRINSGGESETSVLTVKHLRVAFTGNRSVILIHGEGGSGKTTLAFQVARWAMSRDKSARLCEAHAMIPVLIDSCIEYDKGKGFEAFKARICGQLRLMIDEQDPLPEDLVTQLLERQRILVIIDRLSEMNEATKNLIRPSDSAFPANALLVTSRTEENLDDVEKIIIEPLKIEGNQLSEFMSAYLTARKKRKLFVDAEFFGHCQKLSLLVGPRKITVLLAKLYAEQMISAKENAVLGELPTNIPDLMLQYLNEINRGVGENRLEDRTVHHYAKLVAWECLKKNFRPALASLDEVIKAVGETENPMQMIEYLEDRLHLIKTIEPAMDKVGFTLDPLSEYLAGLHVVESNHTDRQWREFLIATDDAPGAPDAIKGFLLAVRDCCMTDDYRPAVPRFVLDGLAERVGLSAAPQAPPRQPVTTH